MQSSIATHVCPMPNPSHGPATRTPRPSINAIHKPPHHVFFFRFPCIFPRVFLLPFPIGSIRPLNKSRTRTSFSEPRALSLLTLPHLNLVRFPLQILLVPALHPIHLRFPALCRAWQDLALAVSSAIGDADRLGLGVGVSLCIDVVVCGRAEGNPGLGG